MQQKRRKMNKHINRICTGENFKSLHPWEIQKINNLNFLNL